MRGRVKMKKIKEKIEIISKFPLKESYIWN